MIYSTALDTCSSGFAQLHSLHPYKRTSSGKGPSSSSKKNFQYFPRLPATRAAAPACQARRCDLGELYERRRYQVFAAASLNASTHLHAVVGVYHCMANVGSLRYTMQRS